MQDKVVMGWMQVLLGNDLKQGLLRGLWGLCSTHSHAIPHAKDVCINSKRGLIKDDIEDNIGRFPTYAW